MQQNEDYVLRVLQDVGLVTRPQIEKARSRLNGASNVVDLLIKDGIVSETDVSRTLATQAQMDWIDISSMVIPPEVITQIRAEDARRFKVIPVAFGETGLVVAVSDPLDIDTIDSLSFLLQREIELVCTSPEKIRDALIKYYGTADEAADILQQRLGEDIDLGLEFGEGAEAAAGDEADAPIIRMVSMLLIEAHRAGASDIHLEPLDKKFRVRFRIDGVLQEMQAPPKRLQSAITSRLKMNVACSEAMRLDQQHRHHPDDRRVCFIAFGDRRAVADFQAKIDIFAEALLKNVRGFVGSAVIFDKRFANFFRAGANQFEFALQQKAQAVDCVDVERIAYGHDQTGFTERDGDDFETTSILGANLFDNGRWDRHR